MKNCLQQFFICFFAIGLALILFKTPQHSGLDFINEWVSNLNFGITGNSKTSNSRSILSEVHKLHPHLPIKISREVEVALDHQSPILSLESTIISHGMPYPQNYQTAKEVESIVRERGVTPATIAIINGTIHVGLNDTELHYLATVGKSAIKTSRRDLAFVLSQGLTGSTTVSATIFISNLVGIKIFVTGGLGGVHRGAEVSMDISADLTELGRNDVTVISAGVKSILDIGKTLEYMETQGVTVITYGTDEFPAFFTKHSGYKSLHRLDTPLDCAKLIHSNQELKLNSGIVIAVPNDNEDSAEIDVAIKESIKESEKDKISGKDITPYLLQKVNEKTKGKSLNFIKNNAAIGSKIASEYYQLIRKEAFDDQQLIELQKNNQHELNIDPIEDRKKKRDVVVVGGCVLDMISHPFKESGFQLGTSNPGSLTMKMGGVARNVAETLSRLELEPLFISQVGNDIHSNYLIDHCKSTNMPTYGIKMNKDRKTAIYNAIMNDHGDLAVAIAEMDIFDDITPKFVDEFRDEILNSKLILMDGNIPIETMKYISEIVNSHPSIELWFEPTSVYKSTKVISSDILSSITYTSPNIDELLIMSKEIIKKNSTISNHFQNLNYQSRDLENIKIHNKILIESGIKYVITKMGSEGMLLVFRDELGEYQYYKFDAPPVDAESVVDVTGAGDSMVGGVVWALFNNYNISESIRVGEQCAKASLLSTHPVSPDLSLQYLHLNHILKK
eukprot:gene841-1048_t